MAKYKQNLIDEIGKILGEESLNYLRRLTEPDLRKLKAVIQTLSDKSVQQEIERWVEEVEVVVCEPGEGPRFMRQPKKTTMGWGELCVSHPLLARRTYAEMEPGEVARQIKVREK